MHLIHSQHQTSQHNNILLQREKQKRGLGNYGVHGVYSLKESVL